MKITKWVDFGQEIEINVDSKDISAALAEAFAVVTKDRLGEEGPNRNDILIALNAIAAFLNALTDQQISLMTLGQRITVSGFLAKHAARFKIPKEME